MHKPHQGWTTARGRQGVSRSEPDARLVVRRGQVLSQCRFSSKGGRDGGERRRGQSSEGSPGEKSQPSEAPRTPYPQICRDLAIVVPFMSRSPPRHVGCGRAQVTVQRYKGSRFLCSRPRPSRMRDTHVNAQKQLPTQSCLSHMEYSNTVISAFPSLSTTSINVV